MPRSVNWAERKAQCEECIPLDARQLLRNQQREDGGAGVVRWHGLEWADGAAVRLEHGAEHWSGGAEVVLRYWLDSRGVPVAQAPGAEDAEPIVQRLSVESSPQHLGGRRWWWVCPLRDKEGAPCGRRVGVLYFAPGCEVFGCRDCLGLVYRSAQEWNTRLGQVRREGNTLLWQELAARVGSHNFGLRRARREFRATRY